MTYWEIKNALYMDNEDKAIGLLNDINNYDHIRGLIHSGLKEGDYELLSFMIDNGIDIRYDTIVYKKRNVIDFIIRSDDVHLMKLFPGIITNISDKILLKTCTFKAFKIIQYLLEEVLFDEIPDIFCLFLINMMQLINKNMHHIIEPYITEKNCRSTKYNVLEFAIRYKNIDIAHILIDIVRVEQFTNLCWNSVFSSKNLDLLEKALDRTGIQKYGKKKNTFLHILCDRLKPDEAGEDIIINTIELILEKMEPAERYCTNGDGLTAYDIAAKNNLPFANLLKKQTKGAIF